MPEVITLFERIMAKIKFYFSHLIFYYSLKCRIVQEPKFCQTTSFVFLIRSCTDRLSSYIGQCEIYFYKTQFSFYYNPLLLFINLLVLLWSKARDTMNLESSGSSKLAETIVKFQDKIQDTKFAIASLKIQLAFRILIKIFNKKKTLYSTRIFERLKDISTKQISACMKEPIQKIFATMEIIRERNLLKIFTKIKVYAETVEKQHSSIKRISSFNSLNDSRKKINNSSQGFQTNVYQMSGEQMDEQCIFLKDQIKKIEKSFQDFYNNLQKH